MKGKRLLTLIGLAISCALSVNAQKNSKVDIEALVGYYNVGVKPKKPFFRSRWYMKDKELYTIYDSDQDRLLKLYQDGKLRHNIIFNEDDVPEVRDDTTYYLILTLENNKL